MTIFVTRVSGEVEAESEDEDDDDDDCKKGSMDEVCICKRHGSNARNNRDVQLSVGCHLVYILSNAFYFYCLSLKS